MSFVSFAVTDIASLGVLAVQLSALFFLCVLRVLRGERFGFYLRSLPSQ